MYGEFFFNFIFIPSAGLNNLNSEYKQNSESNIYIILFQQHNTFSSHIQLLQCVSMLCTVSCWVS